MTVRDKNQYWIDTWFGFGYGNYCSILEVNSGSGVGEYGFFRIHGDGMGVGTHTNKSYMGTLPLLLELVDEHT